MYVHTLYTSVIILFHLILCPGSKLGLSMFVFGPETHMTAIVCMALGHRPIPKSVLVESGQPVSFLGSKNVSQ